MSCAECRRGQAADRNFSASLSLVPTESPPRGIQRLGLPKESRENIHTQSLEAAKNFPLALRIPEYLALPKKPLKAVEPKTKLRTECSRVGFRELL